MKVIEIEQPLNTHEKMSLLQSIREDIGERAFRSAVASIQTKHIVSLMYWKGKRLSRAQLCDRVNLTLYSFGCEPMSYDYFRDWL
jgi:hypothetical protein